MNGVSKLFTLEEVAFISFKKIPYDLALLTEIFKCVSDAGIGVDMISQTSPLSGNVSVSFTFLESDMVKILKTTKEIGEKHPLIKPIVSSGNCKLTLSGEEMRTTPGVFTKALSALSSVNAELLQVTTSETEVSLLIPTAHLEDAKSALEKEFSL